MTIRNILRFKSELGDDEIGCDVLALVSKKAELSQLFEDTLGQLKRHCIALEKRGAQKDLGDLLWISGVMKRIENLNRRLKWRYYYLIDSMLLRRCYDYLMSFAEDEGLVYITGIKINDRLYAFSTLLEVKIEDKSAVHAIADARDSHLLLKEITENGSSLLGLFHKHPGIGSVATYPSGDDIQTIETFKEGFPNVIGAVFVKDGYVRFFGFDPEQREVYVKGNVEKVKETVFRIKT